MIDRKALWISIAILLATIVAIIWWLSLLPDWRHVSLDGPGGNQTVNGLLLFVPPFGVAFAIVSLYARKWLAGGTDDAVQPHRRWAGMFLIAFSLLTGLFYAAIIARSLDYGLAMDRKIIGRVFLIAMGILMLVAGNAVPKLPWLPMRFRPLQLDPWQENRHRRFAGKLLVGMGLFFVSVGAFLPLLPPAILRPAMLGLGPAIVAAGLWHRARMKREPSPQ